MSDETKIENLNTETSRKNKQITFDDFFELLQSAIKLKESKAVSKCFQLIKSGFIGDQKPEQIERTLEILKNWRGVDSLAVKLALEKRLGKLKPFAAQLANRLRFYFSSSLNYPLSLSSEGNSQSYIIDWINNPNILPSSSAKPETNDKNEFNKELDSSYSPENLLKMKFVCLLGETNDTFLCEAIDTLLKNYQQQRNKNFRTSLNSYIKLIASLLSSKTSPDAIGNVLIAGIPLTEAVAELKDRENGLLQNVQDLRRRTQQLETEQFSLKNQLDKANSDVMSLNSSVDDKNAALKEWEERHNALDNYWQQIMKQKLTKQSADLKKSIKSEVDEIQLSLEGTTPDVEMAIDLIKQIKELIGRDSLNAK